MPARKKGGLTRKFQEFQVKFRETRGKRTSERGTMAVLWRRLRGEMASEQRMITVLWQRLCVEDVEYRCAEVTAVKGLQQCRLVDQRAAGDVDERCTGTHGGESAGVAQSALVVQW